MTPLTREQKEYMQLKSSMGSMREYFMKLTIDGKIVACRQPPVNPPRQSDFIVEQLFYAYMEVLQEEHLKSK